MKKYIFFAIIGGFFVLSAIVLSITRTNTSLLPPLLPTPTPVGLFLPTTIPLPSSTTNPPVAYPSGAIDKLVEQQTNRVPLSSNDQAIRTSLISTKRGNDGEIVVTPTFRLSYTKTLDIFEAEILDADFVSAKNDVIFWLKNKELTQEGICHLPLSFYMNPDVAESLRNSHSIFIPYVENCQ